MLRSAVFSAILPKTEFPAWFYTATYTINIPVGAFKIEVRCWEQMLCWLTSPHWQTDIMNCKIIEFVRMCDLVVCYGSNGVIDGSAAILYSFAKRYHIKLLFWLSMLLLQTYNNGWFMPLNDWHWVHTMQHIDLGYSVFLLRGWSLAVMDLLRWFPTILINVYLLSDRCYYTFIHHRHEFLPSTVLGFMATDANVVRLEYSPNVIRNVWLNLICK